MYTVQQSTEQATPYLARYPTQLPDRHTELKSMSSHVSFKSSPTLSPSITFPSNNGKPENKITPSKFSQWTTKWITDWWGMELICWIVAALSLLAIVVVLESHKSKPLPEWPFKLTLNSLISIFATIAQMAMMKPVVECISQLKWLWFVRKQKLADFQAFDDASRGPTGSLILLGRLRSLHLVTLGALIAVFSIAFGAFAQQVVTYPLRSHPFENNATTPLVLNLTGPTNGNLPPDGMIMASLYTGFSSNMSTLDSITPSCSTGNCSWAPYPSLGICSTVVDLTSTITTNTCNQTQLDAYFQDASLENPGYPCFNYTIPFDAVGRLPDNPGFTAYGNVSLSNVVPLTDLIYGMQILTLSPAVGLTNSSLATIYLMYQPNIESSINSSLADPIAYRFTFDLCIQTYNTTVSNGLAHTSIISSIPFETEIEEIQLSTDEMDFSIVGNLDANFSVEGHNFGAERPAFASLSAFIVSNTLDSCSKASVNLSSNADETFNYWCTMEGLFGQSFMDRVNSSDALELASGMIHNVATAMTNALRTNGGIDTNVIQVQGIAFSLQPFVGTDYTWFIFPLSLVSLTLVFLIATISKSQRLGSRVWKASNIATLQGLHTDLHAHLGGLSSVSEMDEKAKSIEVRFDMKSGRAEHGVEYRLVESKQDPYWKS